MTKEELKNAAEIYAQGRFLSFSLNNMGLKPDDINNQRHRVMIQIRDSFIEGYKLGQKALPKVKNVK